MGPTYHFHADLDATQNFTHVGKSEKCVTFIFVLDCFILLVSVIATININILDIILRILDRSIV